MGSRLGTGKRVAVLYGGPSAEHEVSLRSADGLASWLAESGLDVLLVHLRRDGRCTLGRVAAHEAGDAAATGVARAGSQGPGRTLAEVLPELLAEADVAFPIMHGTLGEDGSLQGFLRVLGLPCAGPGVLASALAMDKARAKAVLAATTGLRMPRGETVAPSEWARDRREALARAGAMALPCIVKPLDGGSSVGLSRVDLPEQLAPAIECALAVEGVTGALIEEFVAGDEVTCAVYGNPESGVEALPPILIRPVKGGLFDWDAKYTPGASEEICPAPLPEAALARIRADALAAYRALGCRGFARVDFILCDGTPWFLELNTLPGLTRESLFPKAARAAGHSLPQLFRRLVELARESAPGAPAERADAPTSLAKTAP